MLRRQLQTRCNMVQTGLRK